MKSLFKFVPLGIILVLLASCTTAKRISYLLDMEYNVDYPAPPAPELVIQPNDCLGIQVSSEDPVLSAPFNLYSSEGNAIQFIVDKNGNIEFPVLGTMNVGGKTVTAIRDDIAMAIRNKGYIQRPVVHVSLENFTVTVIGKIGNKVIPVSGNSLNLLQVIAMSGEGGNKADINDVMVVRTENGVRHSYSVDLQSKDLFDSPVFYLKQNDLVYVKPKGTTLSASGQTVMSFVTAGLSLLNIISNFILWSQRG